MAATQEHILGSLSTEHTVASIAKRFNMSPRNLARVFGKAAGMTPIAFLNDARVDAVRRYLETTDLPIKAIASRCGFRSAAGLRRLFVRRLGIGPHE